MLTSRPPSAAVVRGSPRRNARNGRLEPVLDGNTLIRRRVAAGLQVEQLARMVGVHRATLYRWEADGYIRHYHRSLGARVLAWFLALETPRALEVDQRLRRYVKERRIHEARVWLIVAALQDS
jgi:transcriptional regulator with XRE-family HTH domain